MTLPRRYQVRHIICAHCGKPANVKAINGKYHPRCQQQASHDRRLARIRAARAAREEAQQ